MAIHISYVLCHGCVRRDRDRANYRYKTNQGTDYRYKTNQGTPTVVCGMAVASAKSRLRVAWPWRRLTHGCVRA